MSTIIALSPILLWIVILVIGLMIVKAIISKNQKGTSTDLEKRVAALELEVNKLKSER